MTEYTVRSAIAYSEFTFDRDFRRSDQERQIDKLLRHFANIALAWQAGLLSTADVRPIQYYVLRVMRNPEIKKYVHTTVQWAQEAGLGQHPYAALNQLSEELAK